MKINRYYRKWLQIPISGNITHLNLTKKMLGYNIKTVQNIHAQCKLSVCRILKTSRNEEVRTLYNLTSSKNVKSDFILNSIRVPEIRQIKHNSTKALSKQTNESTWNGFLNLNEQSGIIRSLVEQFLANSLIKWQNVTSKLPDKIIKFSRRYVINSLSNGTNLQKWKQNDSPNCLLCNSKETQLHLFNSCEAALKRYEWRHNSIIKTITNNLIMSTSEGFKLNADIEGFENTNTLFKSSRPNKPNAEMYR